MTNIKKDIAQYALCYSSVFWVEVILLFMASYLNVILLSMIGHLVLSHCSLDPQWCHFIPVWSVMSCPKTSCQQYLQHQLTAKHLCFEQFNWWNSVLLFLHHSMISQVFSKKKKEIGCSDCCQSQFINIQQYWRSKIASKPIVDRTLLEQIVIASTEINTFHKLTMTHGWEMQKSHSSMNAAAM